eukprot:TRINITY_DN8876_c0_g1_i1.p1 TRINITY_DN8876_c0_g1~~TRINITY_DN8876_c0_g1_i1.p1  ORF type:complete len:426 (-),score=117.02 TRINITY_DN8876_c0_g1_i1:180-1457(-)
MADGNPAVGEDTPLVIENALKRQRSDISSAVDKSGLVNKNDQLKIDITLATVPATAGADKTICWNNCICCFGSNDDPRSKRIEWGVFLVTVLIVPVICGAFLLWDWSGHRKAISNFIVFIFILAGTINIIGNIIPFMVLRKEARPVILEFLFNIAVAELINSVYYVFSIILGPPDNTDSLYMSLIQASDLPQYFFALDLYLPAVSSLFSVWMSSHFSKAANVAMDSSYNDREDEFQVRWISMGQILRTWFIPFAVLGALFMFKVNFTLLVWIMFAFRVLCTVYMMYAFFTLIKVNAGRNVWIMQTRLYIIISIAWQFLYSLDDGVPETLFDSNLLRNFLYGYLPISAAFARILMNGTVFVFTNRTIVSAVTGAFIQCRRISARDAGNNEEDDEGGGSTIVQGTPVVVRSRWRDREFKQEDPQSDL